MDASGHSSRVPYTPLDGYTSPGGRLGGLGQAAGSAAPTQAASASGVHNQWGQLTRTRSPSHSESEPWPTRPRPRRPVCFWAG